MADRYFSSKSFETSVSMGPCIASHLVRHARMGDDGAALVVDAGIDDVREDGDGSAARSVSDGTVQHLPAGEQRPPLGVGTLAQKLSACDRPFVQPAVLESSLAEVLLEYGFGLDANLHRERPADQALVLLGQFPHTVKEFLVGHRKKRLFGNYEIVCIFVMP